ncbi:hypothetical protein GBA52_007776, partial [Prunus armeniaca]
GRLEFWRSVDFSLHLGQSSMVENGNNPLKWRHAMATEEVVVDPPTTLRCLNQLSSSDE